MEREVSTLSDASRRRFLEQEIQDALEHAEQPWDAGECGRASRSPRTTGAFLQRGPSSWPDPAGVSGPFENSFNQEKAPSHLAAFCFVPRFWGPCIPLACWSTVCSHSAVSSYFSKNSCSANSWPSEQPYIKVTRGDLLWSVIEHWVSVF